MATCSRCGSAFEERRFLLLVCGRTGTYDSYECADAARARPPRQLVDDLLREVEALRRQRPAGPGDDGAAAG